MNAGKCRTIAFKVVSREKRIAIDKNTIFDMDGVATLSLQRSDQWTYLGIPFTAEGRAVINPVEDVTAMMELIGKAPLKPQQRLSIVKDYLLPGYYHKLILGDTSIGILCKFDRVTRSYVRKWLCLLKDSPNAYIHANVQDGGLGIRSIRWNIPKLPLERLYKLRLDIEQRNKYPGQYLLTEIQKVKKRLSIGDDILRTIALVARKWALELYGKVDGAGLNQSSAVPQQITWIRDGTSFLSGKDFIYSCKLRINPLPTEVQ